MRSPEIPNRERANADMKELVQLIVSGREPNESEPQALPLNAISQVPSLFQPRLWSLLYAQRRSADHIATLYRSLEHGPLDPIAVTPFGDKWVVIDGHYRLKAYQLKEWSEPVPVEVIRFQGSPEEQIKGAIGYSVDQNAKNKLALLPTEKSDIAWQYTVLMRDASVREIAKRAGVGKSLVQIMKKTLEVLEAEPWPRGFTKRSPELLSWQGARIVKRDIESGAPSRFEDELDHRREVQDVKRRLENALGWRLKRGVGKLLLEALSHLKNENMGLDLVEELREALDSYSETEGDPEEDAKALGI